MENGENTPATLESVWEAFREADRQRKEGAARFNRELAKSSAKFNRELAESSAKFDRELAESRAESERERKEAEAKFNRELAASRADSERERKESEAKFDRELAESRAESERERKESEAKFKQEMAESRAEFDKRNVEFDKRSAEFDKQRAEFNKEQAELSRQIRELKESVNGISKSNGLFAEEYFFNSFENGKRTFFGETFDDIEQNVKGLESKDEYDIVLINGKSVGVIEVKYKGRLDDIPKIINKAGTFRANYPKFQNHKIYLAMASMMFNQRLEDRCKKEGIAIVKQVGDTVVINDEHLKAY